MEITDDTLQRRLGDSRDSRSARWKEFWRKVKRQKVLLFLLLPALVYFIIFNYVPMYGVLIAFKKFRMVEGQSFITAVFTSPWAGQFGLDHFKNFVNGPFFWQLFRNTFLLGIYSILFGFPAPIIFALLLN